MKPILMNPWFFRVLYCWSMDASTPCACKQLVEISSAAASAQFQSHGLDVKVYFGGDELQGCSVC
jgi:hypothetical protein